MSFSLPSARGLTSVKVYRFLSLSFHRGKRRPSSIGYPQTKDPPSFSLLDREVMLYCFFPFSPLKLFFFPFLLRGSLTSKLEGSTPPPPSFVCGELSPTHFLDGESDHKPLPFFFCNAETFLFFQSLLFFFLLRDSRPEERSPPARKTLFFFSSFICFRRASVPPPQGPEPSFPFRTRE